MSNLPGLSAQDPNDVVDAGIHRLSLQTEPSFGGTLQQAEHHLALDVRRDDAHPAMCPAWAVAAEQACASGLPAVAPSVGRRRRPIASASQELYSADSRASLVIAIEHTRQERDGPVGPPSSMKQRPAMTVISSSSSQYTQAAWAMTHQGRASQPGKHGVTVACEGSP